MSESFDFDEPDHFTAGAVGPPGERVFYLQARQEGQTVSLKLEKQQVAALCEYLAGLLTDLPPVTGEPPADVALLEPALGEWVIGALAVAYEKDDDRILLVAEELIPEEDGGTTELTEPGEPDAAVARFRLTRAQAAAMVRHARRVVASGRPFCPICGRPMDPSGHFCPRNN